MGFSFIRRTRDAMFWPKVFYERISKKDEFKWSVLYVAVVSLILGIFSGLGTILAAMLWGALNAWVLLAFPMIVIFTPIFAVLFSFIWYGVVHLFVLLFKGKQGYKETYRAMAFSIAPSLPLGILSALIGIFPIVGQIVSVLLNLASWIWSIWIGATGLAVLQKMSMGKAVASILLPIVVIIVVVLVLLVLALILFEAFVLSLFGVTA